MLREKEAFDRLCIMFHPDRQIELLRILYTPSELELNKYVVKILEFFLVQNANGLQGGQQENSIWDAITH
ncbi:MAG: hypothetical protein QG570_655 [Patescibacteria group bacterium]|nr:hypothetical protein [Patescibacteria group bacterium]